jgi:hypothetical protein
VSLLNTRHADPLSAAISLAENRADKAQMLRADGLNGIAESSARRLAEYVRDFIDNGQVPDNVRERLDAAVTRAKGEVCRCSNPEDAPGNPPWRCALCGNRLQEVK